MTWVSVRPHKQYPAEPEVKYTSVTEVDPSTGSATSSPLVSGEASTP